MFCMQPQLGIPRVQRYVIDQIIAILAPGRKAVNAQPVLELNF
jgi:hypothetical protein